MNDTLNNVDDLLEPSEEDTIANFSIQREAVSGLLNIENINSRKAVSRIICNQPCKDEELHDVELKEWLQPGKKRPNRNVIVGQPQTGKTEFLKKLLRILREGKWYDYIFYVPLNAFVFSDKLNVLQLLTTQSPSLSWIHFECDNSATNSSDLEIFKKVIEKISKDETVCIIFDEFDKSNFAYNNQIHSDTRRNYMEKAEAGLMISTILRYGFGKKCQCLILLNPWMYLQLRSEPKLCFMAEIWVQGINHEGQKQLLTHKKFGCKNTECSLGDACLGMVILDHSTNKCSVCELCHNDNCHHEIQALFYIPSNIKLLLKEDIKPSTPVIVAASLFTSQLRNTLKHYSKCQQKPFSFKNICHFAWKNYAENNFAFYEDDLLKSLNSSELKLTKLDINIFFSYIIPLNSCHPVFFFSHILLQEFLSAIWLLSCSKNDLESALESYHELSLASKFPVVCEFIYEICKHSQLRKCRNSTIWNISTENINYLKRFIQTLND